MYLSSLMRLAVIGVSMALSPLVAGAGELIGRDRLIGELVPITGDDPVRKVDLSIQFAVNSSVLSGRDRAQLNELAAAMNAPELEASVFEVNGHTDARGSARHNQALSEARALAVGRYLRDVGGVAADRLIMQGFGEERPKNAFSPEAAENRRVEIINVTPPRAGSAAGAITD